MTIKITILPKTVHAVLNWVTGFFFLYTIKYIIYHFIIVETEIHASVKDRALSSRLFFK